MQLTKYFALLFLFISPSLFSAQKTVSVATLGDYAPLLFSLDKSFIRSSLNPGENTHLFTGYGWDVFRESFHAMGYNIHLRVEPWARAMKEFETNKVDLLFPVGKNKKRLIKFNYSKKSINDSHYVIYVKENSPIQWTGLDSLTHLKIGSIRGYSYGDKWINTTNIDKINVKYISVGFDMLAKNRLDGFVGDEFTWDHYLQKQEQTDKFRKLPSFDHAKEHVVALKDNKQGQKLLDDFDTGKQILIKTGRLQELKLKWSIK